MNVMQDIKYAKSVVPQSITGTDTDGSTVDCLGFKYATAVCHLGAVGAADFDKLEIEESDDDSSWAVVTGLTFTDPLQTGDDGFWVANIDLRKRKRYLRWVVDPGAAATLVAAFFMLTQAVEHPNTDTERGVTQSLTV